MERIGFAAMGLMTAASISSPGSSNGHQVVSRVSRRSTLLVAMKCELVALFSALGDFMTKLDGACREAHDHGPCDGDKP